MVVWPRRYLVEILPLASDKVDLAFVSIGDRPDFEVGLL